MWFKEGHCPTNGTRSEAHFLRVLWSFTGDMIASHFFNCCSVILNMLSFFYVFRRHPKQKAISFCPSQLFSSSVYPLLFILCFGHSSFLSGVEEIYSLVQTQGLPVFFSLLRKQGCSALFLYILDFVELISLLVGQSQRQCHKWNIFFLLLICVHTSLRWCCAAPLLM